MTEDPDSPRAELVMPFVVVTSKGGPYDDEAFMAGWYAGEIDRMLTGAQGVDIVLYRDVPRALLPQIDLIAMRHGYKVHAYAKYQVDGWATVHIKPPRHL